MVARSRLPVPQTVLIAAGPFSKRLPSAGVAEALGRGLQAAGWPGPDVLELGAEAPDVQARLRRSHALLLAVASLDRDRLPRSAAFALATDARQSGVPAYAVAAHNNLDAFDARILDLQVIIEASTLKGLEAAGERLGGLL